MFRDRLVVNAEKQTTNAPAKNETKTNNNFLPLDEIRAPELKTNGYSIYDSED